MPRAAPLRSSALKGSRSATRIPMTFVRWLRRLLATRLGSYPSSSITRCTRSLVAAATPYLPLTTLETVAVETPARAATWWMVMREEVAVTREAYYPIVIDNELHTHRPGPPERTVGADRRRARPRRRPRDVEAQGRAQTTSAVAVP